MAYSSLMADNIVGQPRTPDMQCNHVVNLVLTGSKQGRLAREYLTYGKKVKDPVAGTVVVGVDGVHVGIFVSEFEFIHSSSSKMKVVKVTKEQLDWVFPNDYEYRME
jgi:hypothetical protein